VVENREQLGRSRHRPRRPRIRRGECRGQLTPAADQLRRAAILHELAAYRGNWGSDWHDLLDRHNEIVRRGVLRHLRREVKMTGDGFLITFDGPARSSRCSLAISEAVEDLGLQVRAGLHTGEVEMTGQ
jgi:class 3 adenylate cyclase